MKNMVLLLCILFLCSWAEADAQGFHLQPTPQKYVGSEDSVFIPARYSLQVGATLRGSAAEQLLAGLFPDAAVTADFSVCIGMKGDKSVRKYAARIPKQAEGYYLKIDKEGFLRCADAGPTDCIAQTAVGGGDGLSRRTLPWCGGRFLWRSLEPGSTLVAA